MNFNLKTVVATLYFCALLLLILTVVVPRLLSGDTESVLAGLATIFLSLTGAGVAVAQLFKK